MSQYNFSPEWVRQALMLSQSCSHSKSASILPRTALSRCDLDCEFRARGGDVGVPGEAEGGQDQHHEDQEYVDLGHHDPVLP